MNEVIASSNTRKFDGNGHVLVSNSLDVPDLAFSDTSGSVDGYGGKAAAASFGGLPQLGMMLVTKMFTKAFRQNTPDDVVDDLLDDTATGLHAGLESSTNNLAASSSSLHTTSAVSTEVS